MRQTLCMVLWLALPQLGVVAFSPRGFKLPVLGGSQKTASIGRSTAVIAQNNAKTLQSSKGKVPFNSNRLLMSH